MSRAAVRDAVVSYLSSAGIEFLSTVKAFPPKFTSEQEFYSYDGDDSHNSGAIVFVWISSQRESRIALGGPHDGRKAVEYEFALEVYFRSSHPKAEDAGADNDTFLDSLTAAIRADRNAGAPSVIFQWGEGTFPGSTDIEVASDFPRVLRGSGSATQTYSNVRVSVVEILES